MMFVGRWIDGKIPHFLLGATGDTVAPSPGPTRRTNQESLAAIGREDDFVTVTQCPTLAPSAVHRSADAHPSWKESLGAVTALVASGWMRRSTAAATIGTVP